MEIEAYQYDAQEGYYGSKEDYYDSDGCCYNSVRTCEDHREEKRNKFIISQDKVETLRYEIKKYFNEERGEELGEIACDMILQFFIEKLAPDFYNQGMEDAYRQIIEKLTNLLEIPTN